MTSESIRYAIGSRERLEPGFPQAVHVRDAVGDVLAVGPHSESGKLTYGFWPAARLRGDVHLDPCAFRELHFFQWLEDSVLVFGGDSHDVRPRNSRIPGWPTGRATRLHGPPKIWWQNWSQWR